MADANTVEHAKEEHVEPYIEQTLDIDPAETAEWIDSLEYVLNHRGSDRAKYLLSVLEQKARQAGVDIPTAVAGLLGEGADVVGSNCGNGSETMVEVARGFTQATDRPIIIQSNAGLPENRGG